MLTADNAATAAAVARQVGIAPSRRTVTTIKQGLGWAFVYLADVAVQYAAGRPMFALPGTRFGPTLEEHFRFHSAGGYRLWAQCRLANGHVITVPFTLQAT